MNKPVIIGYCVKCKADRPMRNVSRGQFSHSRKTGLCTVCGCGMEAKK